MDGIVLGPTHGLPVSEDPPFQFHGIEHDLFDPTLNLASITLPDKVRWREFDRAGAKVREIIMPWDGVLKLMWLRIDLPPMEPITHKNFTRGGEEKARRDVMAKFDAHYGLTAP